jgi:hypothetical protein
VSDDVETTETRADPEPRARWRHPILLIVAIWAGWAIAMLSYQEIVLARVGPERPDAVLEWTPGETGLQRANGRPYLQEDVFASHIAFDSEYYLSIAVLGYDDPDVTQYEGIDGTIALNYAFMPAYPMAMRVVATPLTWVGVPPLSAAAIAGVAVSLASALAAMVALFHLARRQLGESAGVRAAFYLLVFPTGFFLAQVYSEALFLAAALGALAFIAYRQPLPAAALSVVAVLTRPVGVALAVAVAVALGLLLLRARGDDRPSRAELAGWVVALAAPVVTYLAWSSSALGRAFDVVQREYFGREVLNIEGAWANWTSVINGLAEARPETRVYYGLEIAAVVLALVACAWAVRRWPAATAFGLATLVISITSGAPQGMVRYVLAVPPLFLLLSRLGEHPAFDRVWTIVSVMLMALLAALYTFDFWVA